MQREWLMAIRDHLGVNIEIRPVDMMDAPEFSGRGGIVRARALFGAAAGSAGRIDGRAGGMMYITGIYQKLGGGGS